ncbi:MAG: hypothetical protein IJV50_08510 [Lachnospiraceae bacterium]|nr:hypothetical protein [Lachnospiraceae bacterium]
MYEREDKNMDTRHIVGSVCYYGTITIMAINVKVEEKDIIIDGNFAVMINGMV